MMNDVSSEPSLAVPAVGSVASAHEGPSHLEREVTAYFDEWRCPLMRYLLACRLGLQDSEEIVQDVFLALFRHLSAGKSRRSIRGWVFRVAHNLMLKRQYALRASSKVVAPADGQADIAHPDPGPGPEDQLRMRQRQARLLAVVAALPERERACVHLRAEGLKYREIADVLGVSLGAVALSLARAMGRLARADER